MRSMERLGSESNRRQRLCRPLHDHSATQPSFRIKKAGVPLFYGLLFLTCPALLKLRRACHAKRVSAKHGAGNEIRTRDLNLGKVALYQLSYSRFKGYS